MKSMIALGCVISLLGSSALAAGSLYSGNCSVLRQPTYGQPAKLLAVAEVNLKAGETKTLYKMGPILYQISLNEVPSKQGKKAYFLDLLITYGVSNFLAVANTTISEGQAEAPGLSLGLPNYPTLSCGPN